MKKVNNVLDLFKGCDVPDLSKYQQQVDISITENCSLMCPYCISGMHVKQQHRESLIDKVGIDDFIECLEEKFAPYPNLLISIIGPGEPSESKYFTPLCRYFLKKGYKIKVATNISGINNFKDIAEGFTPKYMKDHTELIVSFHYGAFLELGKRGEIRYKLFMNNFKMMVEMGYNIFHLNTPLSPFLIHTEHNQFIAQAKYLRELSGCILVPVELYGKYHGKFYPRDYTQYEKECVKIIHKELNYNVEEHGKDLKCDYKESKFFDERLKYAENDLKLKNCPCIMFYKHIAIDINGTITYCQMNPPLEIGNIYTIRKPIFAEGLIYCPANICGCKSSGNGHSLEPFGITLNEYYYAYYMQNDQPEIAKFFEDE